MISLDFRGTSSFLHLKCCLDFLIPSLLVSSQARSLNFLFRQQMKFQVFFDFFFFNSRNLWGEEFSSVELKVTVGAVQRGVGGGTAQGPWWLLGCCLPCCAFAPRPRLRILPLWDLLRGMEVPDPSPATWEMMLLPSNEGHLCGAGILLWG